MTADRRVRVMVAGALVVLAIAIAYLAWRGILRGLGGSFDLSVGFAAGQAWLLGRDPYDGAVLRDILAASGGDQQTADQLGVFRNVYVPTTLPLFVPLGVFDWSWAKAFMVGINTVASATIALGLCRLLGWSFGEARAIALVALVLAFAPLQTSMAVGQPGIIATCLIVASTLLERSGHPRTAGVALGLATAAKVQLGLPFLAYQLWRRRWIIAGYGSLVVVGLTALVIVRLELAGEPWLPGWLANLAQLSGPGGINDASSLNPERYSLINLQYLLGSLGVSPVAADAITFVAVAVVGLFVVTRVRHRDRPPTLLVLAAIATLTLLVTYHRYYDAVILVLPVAWACLAWRDGQRLLAAVAFAACADFILPAQTAFNAIEQRQLLPVGFTDSVIWRAGLMTQHVWALLILTVVLLRAAVTVPEPLASAVSGRNEPDV